MKFSLCEKHAHTLLELYQWFLIDLSIEPCFLFLSFAYDKKLKSYYIQQMSVKLKIFVNEVHSYFKTTRQVATGERKTYLLDSWIIDVHACVILSGCALLKKLFTYFIIFLYIIAIKFLVSALVNTFILPERYSLGLAKLLIH